MRFLLSIILFACIFLCSCSATNPMPTETFYDRAISFDLTDAKSMINTLVSYKRNSEDGRNSVLNDVSDILDKYGYEAEIQEYTHNGAMLYHDMPYVIMGEKNLETPVSREFFTVIFCCLNNNCIGKQFIIFIVHFLYLRPEIGQQKSVSTLARNEQSKHACEM